MYIFSHTISPLSLTGQLQKTGVGVGTSIRESIVLPQIFIYLRKIYNKVNYTNTKWTEYEQQRYKSIIYIIPTVSRQNNTGLLPWSKLTISLYGYLCRRQNRFTLVSDYTNILTTDSASTHMFNSLTPITRLC